MWNLFKRKKKSKPSLHTNKFKIGDEVLWVKEKMVVSICDFVNEIDTTNYIVIDTENMENIYEWINESELV